MRETAVTSRVGERIVRIVFCRLIASVDAAFDELSAVVMSRAITRR